MKKLYKGSFTVEAAVVVPTVFMIITVLFYIFFYYHDKNIIAGAAYETVAAGTDRKGYDEKELKIYFQSRVRGKLILFSRIQEEIQIEEEEVCIQCTARKRRMKIYVEMSGKRTEPENFIREVRKVKKIGEGQ